MPGEPAGESPAQPSAATRAEVLERLALSELKAAGKSAEPPARGEMEYRHINPPLRSEWAKQLTAARDRAGLGSRGFRAALDAVLGLVAVAPLLLFLLEPQEAAGRARVEDPQLRAAVWVALLAVAALVAVLHHSHWLRIFRRRYQLSLSLLLLTPAGGQVTEPEYLKQLLPPADRVVLGGLDTPLARVNFVSERFNTFIDRGMGSSGLAGEWFFDYGAVENPRRRPLFDQGSDAAVFCALCDFLLDRRDERLCHGWYIPSRMWYLAQPDEDLDPGDPDLGI
jgi:hypothetical protein